MTDDPCDEKPDQRFSARERVWAWIDCHPRTGWYIAALSTVNVVLNVLQILGH